MARRKKSDNLTNKISAILERDSGMPYTQVLASHDLTPDQFAISVFRAHNDLRERYDEVKDIVGAPSKVSELFDMGEEFVKGQYDRLMGRIPDQTQSKYYQGTFQNSKNIDALIYHALSSNNPKLASEDRGEVINGIKSLPTNLVDYFRSIQLSGLMAQIFQDSPLLVLEKFDQIYQEKTNQPSLFDLSQENHLHRWGDTFIAPSAYWHDINNLKEAVYHTLTEAYAELKNSSREKVIEKLENLTIFNKDFLRGLGLRGVLAAEVEQGKKDSPLFALEYFDLAYQEQTGDNSLFDLNEKHHIHKWGYNQSVPEIYKKDSEFVAEAIYHTLTEKNPPLASGDRSEVLTAVKALPNDLTHYFISLGLNRLVSGNSRKEILNAFDRQFQKLTGNSSLFDQDQLDQLKYDGQTRLIRT